MTPLIKSLVGLTPEAADFIWFDMGILPAFSFAWSDLPGSRLPFEKTAICGYDSKGDRFLVLAQQADETAILLSAWAICKDHYTSTPIFVVVLDAEKGGCHLAMVEGEAEITREQAAPIVGIVAEFLNCCDHQGYEPRSKNSYVNRQRAKKGKAPLIYDWHTVKIEPAKSLVDVAGLGTHASPRKHQRRGHWRNHPNGKRVWVRDCWVGDAEKGTVFKDYQIKIADKERTND